MRAPAGTTRKVLGWTVVDQVMPLPYTVGSTELDNEAWISTMSGLDGTSDSAATIRRHSTLRAGNDFTSTRLRPCVPGTTSPRPALSAVRCGTTSGFSSSPPPRSMPTAPAPLKPSSTALATSRSASAPTRGKGTEECENVASIASYQCCQWPIDNWQHWHWQHSAQREGRFRGVANLHGT